MAECSLTDYELQVGITEMMFRLSSRESRAALAREWFTDELYLDAFLRVKDADFETVRHALKYFAKRLKRTGRF